MKRRVKWVENNLGVTRSALRVYESWGLLSQDFGKYREYDDDDLQTIWLIKELQGLGYSLKEIKEMATDGAFDFQSAMAAKVDELEAKRKELDDLIGFAKMVKLNGRIPMRKEMGSKTYQEHHEDELRGYTVNDAPEGFSDLADLISDVGNDGVDVEVLAKAIATSSKNLFNDAEIRSSIIGDFLLKQIVQRSDQGPGSSDVQLIVSMIYDLFKEEITVGGKQIPKGRFGALFGSNFVNGDLAKINRLAYSREGCSFIADALARFGGFESREGL